MYHSLKKESMSVLKAYIQCETKYSLNCLKLELFTFDFIYFLCAIQFYEAMTKYIVFLTSR
jgi:hypothetical protein